MIVLFGIPSESPLAMVAGALAEDGTDFLVVNQREVLGNRMELRLDAAGLQGQLSSPERTLALESIRGAYLRPMDDQRLPEVVNEPPESVLRQRARGFHELVVQWAEVTPATVINRYSRMGSNFSKPYQAQIISGVGFAVPETLVTNDPDAVLEFRHAHGELIFKSVSSERSVVKLLAENDLQRLDRIKHCPVQFQEYIPGQDFRVHTIGDDVFATLVESSGIDYRYAATRVGEAPTLTAVSLPERIESLCVRLAATLDLEFAGIDLRRDPDGRFVCFEVNPSPAFSYYESHTGQPIAQAVAAHLSRRREIRRPPRGDGGTTASATAGSVEELALADPSQP
jgi:hypothetical protein